MNSLESPLEALVFNYLSYGLLTAVNSIWTWLAVITAAVSLWKIKATTQSSQISRLITPLRCSSPDGSLIASAPPEVHGGAAEKLVAVNFKKLNLSSETASDRVLEREGSTRVKFTQYYTNDFDYLREDDGGDEDEDNGGVAAESEDLVRHCNDLERMMMLRMGDLGLYRYQDLTVLDGNVVRLWDCREDTRAAVEW